MTTNDSGDFDPRFDPAFQRGFDGTEPRGRRQSRADEPRGSSRSLSDDSRGSSRSLSDRSETSPPQPPAAPSAAPAEPAEHPEAPGGANPFVLALAVVSVALVAGGVWGVQAAREPFLRTDAAVDVDYSGLQMLMTFAPMSIALGLATAVGILFLYAVRWRRRP
jgi:hypothetical protein